MPSRLCSIATGSRSTRSARAVPARPERTSQPKCSASPSTSGAGSTVVEGDAGPWLYGIATNLLRRYFRTAERGRRAARRAVETDHGDPTDEALNRVEAAQLGPSLSAALRRLPATDRDALLLLAWAALTYEEISEALDIPVGTVRSRIHRARTSVQTHLNREDTP